MSDYDAIVIGLGGIGSAAAYRLATAPGGRRVLGLEQFELGHDRGASQDVSRITRRSYHHVDYVRLAIQAQAAWAEVEAASGEQLVTWTGGLDLAHVRNNHLLPTLEAIEVGRDPALPGA